MTLDPKYLSYNVCNTEAAMQRTCEREGREWAESVADSMPGLLPVAAICYWKPLSVMGHQRPQYSIDADFRFPSYFRLGRYELRGQ